MSILIITRAVLVRLLFAFHGIMAIWRLYMVTHNVWSWYLGGALLLLFLETLFTIAKKKGNEWKWFCPSVFFYLLSVVPAIWFLELHEIEKRIEKKVFEHMQHNVTNVTSTPLPKEFNNTEETLSLNVEEFGLNITIPLAFPADLWLRVLEQFLLLMLIIGRWILPKGSISHDQLSQLLLVYVGTAADIVEFYEAFSEEEVKYNRMLCFIILGIWTLSLMQFTLVLTATKARRDQVGLPMQATEFNELDGACCNPELYGILTSIVLQDLPFLVVRLLLIFKYRVVSYTNMFFTSKNTLVITLLIYRLIVVQMEARKKRRKQRESSHVPMYNINDINANGKNDCERALRDRNISKSAPNVSQLDTLRRAKRRDNSPISTLNVPHNYSDTNIRMENGQRTPKRKVQRKRKP